MNNWLVGRTDWNPNLGISLLESFEIANKPYIDYLRKAFEDVRKMTETVDSYLFTFNVAGVSKDKVEVEVNENQIVVNAANENYQYNYKSSLVGLNIVPDKAKAVCQDGILTVEVPKLAVKPQKKKLLIN